MTAAAPRQNTRRRPQAAAKPKKTEREKIADRLRKLTDEQLVHRWHDMLDIVLRELQGLDRQRQMMDAVTYGVFNKNKRLLEHPGRRYYDYLLDWYAAAMALAYRRQDDADSRSASLRVVLDELRERPGAYRLDIIRPYVGPLAAEAVIRDEVMASVVGVDGALDVTIIEADLTALAAAGKKVRKFVNAFVAHTDHETRRKGGAGVTFKEITEANEAVNRIAERWLKAFGVYQYPIHQAEALEWLDIFDEPWRPKRPRDGAKTRRYLVTVDRLLDPADMATLLPSKGKRKAHQRERIVEITHAAANLKRGKTTGGEECWPEYVHVERLL